MKFRKKWKKYDRLPFWIQKKHWKLLILKVCLTLEKSCICHSCPWNLVAVTLAQWFATCLQKRPSTKVSRQTVQLLQNRKKNGTKYIEIHRNTSKYIEPFSLATRKQHPPLQSWLCELLQPQHFHVSKSVAIRQYQKHSKTTFRIQSNTSLYTYVVYNMIFYDKNGLLKAEVRDSIGHSVFVILPFLCLILPLIHRLVKHRLRNSNIMRHCTPLGENWDKFAQYCTKSPEGQNWTASENGIILHGLHGYTAVKLCTDWEEMHHPSSSGSHPLRQTPARLFPWAAEQI